MATTRNTSKSRPGTRTQQRAAATKQQRLDESGLRSRIRGHVSARGRRVQGKRDARSR
jgi:hypothetical protein